MRPVPARIVRHGAMLALAAASAMLVACQSTSTSQTGVSKDNHQLSADALAFSGAHWRAPSAQPDTLGAGEGLRQVSFAQHGRDFDPDVSRDAKWVVFASTQHRPTSDLYVKSIDGHTITQLTNDLADDVMPSFSPDGRRVAFSSNRNGSWDLYIVGAEGGQPVQVTSEATHELHPTWSPDGASLAFCRLNPGAGNWELWTIDLVSPATTRFIGNGMLPTWSPTGEHIAFQRARERDSRFFSIWTVEFTDGEARHPTEIASSPSHAFVSPSWSPDGARLVFAAVSPMSRTDGLPVDADIWLVNLDGTARTRLTSDRDLDITPVWAADERVYFVSDRAGTENIWSLAPGVAVQTASITPSPAVTPATAHAADPHAPAMANPVRHGHAAPAPVTSAAHAGAPAHAPAPAETSHAAAPAGPMELMPVAPAPQEHSDVANAPTHDEHGDEHQ